MKFTVELPIIRLGEFDLGGVLYHANYFHLYETCRETFLEASGLTYPQFVADGYHLAVTETSQQFFAPVFYGDAVTFQLWTSDIGKASVTFHYELQTSRNRNKLTHRARTRHGCVRQNSKHGETPSGFALCPLPQPLVEWFTKYAAS